MASKAATKRLTKEYMLIQKSPPPFIIAKPLESNILEWHYVIRGPPQTPYEGGEYHGKLGFPSDYPFKPPSIRMVTPSGRFATDTKICLSMSDFHPGTWNPSWSVSTILTGLLSFMTADETTTGSIKTTDADKRIYAARSHEFNLNNKKFRDVFPELSTPELAPLPHNNAELGTVDANKKAVKRTGPPSNLPDAAARAVTAANASTTTATAFSTSKTAANLVQRSGGTNLPTLPPPSSPRNEKTQTGAAAVGVNKAHRNLLFFWEPWHKWAVVLAVVLYLFFAKLTDERKSYPIPHER